MILFKILWSVDALAALVALYFFLVGLADGTVSSRNIGIWMMMGVIFAGILLGSIWLKNQQQFRMSMGLLLFIAIPALLCLLFILIVIITKPRWN